MSPTGHIACTIAGVYVLSLVVLLKVEGQGALGHKGKHFVLGFLDNNSTLPPELLIISQTDVTANVTVRVPGLSGYSATQRTLHRDQVLGVQLGRNVRLKAGIQTRQGIEIISTADIVVYGVNPVTGDHGNTDVFFALPLDSLGDEYYVASYKPNASQHSAQLGIIAAYNDTVVNVSIPVLDREIQITYAGIIYEEGDTFQLRLHGYDTVQLESKADLTGLKMAASHPIAIVSGDTLTLESEDGHILYDHIVEQLTPTHSWGKSFASMAFADSQTHGDIFRIIASSNDTEIAVKDKRSLSRVNLSESQHTDLNISADDYITIEANKPVFVLQYLPADVSTSSHPPQSFMLTVPPSERSQKQYLFSIVSSTQQTVTVVVNSTHRDSVLLDGQHITLTLNTTSVSWVSIEGASSDYSAIQLPVHSGVHNLTHAQYTPDTVFTAMSPSNHLGMRLKNKPPPYVISHDTGSDVSHQGENIVISDTDGKTVMKQANNAGGSDVDTKSTDYRVKIVAKEDQEVNFHETDSYSDNNGEGLSSTVIAVIVSLATAVFFVVACIVGFLAAEFVCRRENFPSAKVSPYIE